jgi:hypothetical protein
MTVCPEDGTVNVLGKKRSTRYTPMESSRHAIIGGTRLGNTVPW